jgi:hypothetical protein
VVIVGIGYLLGEYVRIPYPTPMAAYASFARMTTRSVTGLGSAKSAASDECDGSGCRVGTARKEYLIASSGLKPTTRMGFVAYESNVSRCVSGRRFAEQAMQFVWAARAKLGKCKRMLFHLEIPPGSNAKAKSPRKHMDDR